LCIDVPEFDYRRVGLVFECCTPRASLYSFRAAEWAEQLIVFDARLHGESRVGVDVGVATP
jgi:hypothetical protein